MTLARGTFASHAHDRLPTVNAAADPPAPSDAGGAIWRARLAVHLYAMPAMAVLMLGLFAFSWSQGFPDRVEALSTPALAALFLAVGLRAWRTGRASERLERVALAATLVVLVLAAFEPVASGRFEIGYPYLLGYGPLAYAASLLFLGARTGSLVAVATFLGLALATVLGVATDQIPPVRAMPLVAAHPILIGLLYAVAWTVATYAREHRDAERAAATDPLTGTLNRRSGERMLDELDGPFHLLVVDLDRFKRVNDARGHAFGDRVLRAAAEALRAAVRSDDAVVRWGGDEFVVVAPGSGDDDRASLLDRVRTTLDAAFADLDVSVGASVGTAKRAAGEHWTAAFDRADADMYGAKDRRVADVDPAGPPRRRR